MILINCVSENIDKHSAWLLYFLYYFFAPLFDFGNAMCGMRDCK